MKRQFTVWLISSTLFFNPACVVFQGKNLPKHEKLLAPDNPNPSTVLLQFDATLNDKPLKTTHLQTAAQGTARAISETLIESGIFTTVATSTAQVQNNFYTLKIHQNTKENSVAAFLSGFVSGYTLGIIPGFATSTFQANSNLLNPEQVEEWTNTAEESITFVIWLPLFPMMFSEKYRPNPAYERTIRNLYRHVFIALREEWLYKKP